MGMLEDDLTEAAKYRNRMASVQDAIRAAVEKHCYCDTRWPATARIADHHLRPFIGDLLAAGFAIVPVKLTDEMRERMAHIADGPLRSYDDYWAEMLDAALVQHLSDGEQDRSLNGSEG